MASILQAIVLLPGALPAAHAQLVPKIAGTHDATEDYTVAITGPLGTRTVEGSGSGTTRVTQHGNKFSDTAIDPQGGSVPYTRRGVLTGNALAISGVAGLSPLPGVSVLKNEFRATGMVLQNRIVLQGYGIIIAKRGSEMRTYEIPLTFTLNATAGTFSGSVAPPGGTRKVTFSGVLQQRAVQAAGFFLGLVTSGEGQSGTVSLGPLP